MLLAGLELLDLIALNVITADPANVNAASIDLTLDATILKEVVPEDDRVTVDIANKKSICTEAVEMTEEGYVLAPGEFVLASSVEVFNLPNNISGEYKLKSTMARNGLEHLNSGWCDAGWNGSKLTLELKNMCRYHSIRIRPGMKIGQIVFFKHPPVPKEMSYATKGQYNGQTVVTAAKELK